MPDALDRFCLDSQRALVTGASRGLGAEIASVLASAGADLVISGRDRIGLERTRQGLEQLGRLCDVVPADLRTMAAPRQLADQALALFGSGDILVNNAALVVVADLLQSTVEHWQQT